MLRSVIIGLVGDLEGDRDWAIPVLRTLGQRGDVGGRLPAGATSDSVWVQIPMAISASGSPTRAAIPRSRSRWPPPPGSRSTAPAGRDACAQETSLRRRPVDPHMNIGTHLRLDAHEDAPGLVPPGHHVERALLPSVSVTGAGVRPLTAAASALRTSHPRLPGMTTPAWRGVQDGR
jgi:hypothetical protein